MMVIGLILLLLALIVGLVGVLANLSAGAALTGGFNIFGLAYDGTSGQLFLFGIVVGAIAMLGIGLVFGALGRRREARRELKESRREAEDLRRQHDRLAQELEEERAQRPAATTTQGTRAAETGSPATGAETSESRAEDVETRPPEQREASDQPSRLRDTGAS